MLLILVSIFFPIHSEASNMVLCTGDLEPLDPITESRIIVQTVPSEGVSRGMLNLREGAMLEVLVEGTTKPRRLRLEYFDGATRVEAKSANANTSAVLFIPNQGSIICRLNP